VRACQNPKKTKQAKLARPASVFLRSNNQFWIGPPYSKGIAFIAVNGVGIDPLRSIDLNQEGFASFLGIDAECRAPEELLARKENVHVRADAFHLTLSRLRTLSFPGRTTKRPRREMMIVWVFGRFFDEVFGAIEVFSLAV
jgi:hypothetical protein